MAMYRIGIDIVILDTFGNNYEKNKGTVIKEI